LIPLAIVNLSVLVIANWQAYVSRLIESEFSESKYVAMTMASLLQATLSGCPILFVVRDQPGAFYLVLTFMVFIICMAVLLLIFVPKVVLAAAFSRRNEQEQRQLIFHSIHQSSNRSSSLRLERNNSILACIGEVKESMGDIIAEEDGEGRSREVEEGAEVVGEEMIRVLSISVEDEEQAPKTSSEGGLVQTSAAANSGADRTL
jgi:hypothetical protein